MHLGTFASLLATLDRHGVLRPRRFRLGGCARLSVAALLLAGCPQPLPPGPPPVEACADAGQLEALPDGGPCSRAIEVGIHTTQGTFEPLVDGGRLTVERGAQGGVHVFLSVRASGLPTRGELRWSLRSADLQLTDQWVRELSCSVERAACGWERRNEFFLLSTFDWIGRDATLEVRWETDGEPPVTLVRAVRME